MTNTHNRQWTVNPSVEQATEHIEKNGNFDHKSLDLDLSGVKIVKFDSPISDFILKYKLLQIVYLVDCAIVSLEGFPSCQLIALDLSKNMIGDDSFIEGLLNCPKLEQILLVSNKIHKLETIFKLTGLKNLKEIDFSNNVAASAECSTIMFQKFKGIEMVNGKDKKGVDFQLEDDEKDEQYIHDEEEEEVEEDDQKNEEEDHEEEEESDGKYKISGRKKK